jgi:DnaJ-related protein SCJ1
MEIDLYVSLKDLYLGKIVSVEIKGKKICPHCRGSGAKSDKHIKTCNSCGGQGVKTQRIQLAPGMFQQITQPCDVCHGTGKVVSEKCPICRGEKVVTGISEKDVYVERGMPDGHQILFENAGDEHPDHSAGHIAFKIVTVPDPIFIREGNDLKMDLRISLIEALAGFEKQLKHLDDHLVTVKRTSVTKPHQVIVKSKEGMPHHGDPSQSGNLHIRVIVDFPDSLTAEQQQGILHLSELAEIL